MAAAAVREEYCAPGMRMNAKGEYQKIDLYGPATYAMWISCYNIFMNCLLMLDAVDLGKLTSYRRRQDKYQATYGPEVWALQYQTEVRTRSEHFIRTKRELIAQYNKDWDSALAQANNDRDKALIIFKAFKSQYFPRRPWDSVFGTVNADSEWWKDELEFTLLRSHSASVSAAVQGDVPIAFVGGRERHAPPGDYSGN